LFAGLTIVALMLPDTVAATLPVTGKGVLMTFTFDSFGFACASPLPAKTIVNAATATSDDATPSKIRSLTMGGTLQHSDVSDR
jgi:hypothetical protein